MNETLLVLLIVLAIPVLALLVIAVESRLAGPPTADEPDAFMTLLPHPAPLNLHPTPKAQFNSPFKPR